MKFQIKVNQLLHLLGVTANQLRNNPDFIRLTGKSNMNSSEILNWILTDIDGNNDLLQYSEDFLKKVQEKKYRLVSVQYSPHITSQLLNYAKVRTKSQTFLKYGPFENVSLVSKLQEGRVLSKKFNSNVVIISKAESFKKYPWAYFGSVQSKKDKYIETLQIDDNKHKKELLRNSTPAIVKGVYYIDGSDGGGTNRIFSNEEQLELFFEAYDAFQDTMNFKSLISYFEQLPNTKEIALPKSPKKN